MPRPRAPFYEMVRLKKGGGEEKVLRCSTCDLDLQKGTWRETKNGILYEVKGWRCPQCGSAKEEAATLVGNE